MRFRFSRMLLIPGLLLACRAVEHQTPPTPTPARGTAGIVASAHPLATEAGLEILHQGGNAFDAAVAVAAALNVVEPMMSGAGGYGTILVYDAASGQVRFLNSSGRIPQAVDSDVFRAPTPGYQENRRGAKAVSTPCNVKAWEGLSTEYGSLPWPLLLRSAERLAREGFEIDEGLAAWTEEAYPTFPAHAQSVYGRGGGPLRTGQKLIQTDLADTFRQLSDEGAGAFHGGVIGRVIANAIQGAQGFLSLEDLESCQAEWWTPIHIDYRGYSVYTASPPATAFPSLVRLGIMSRFEPAEHNSAEHLHRFAEVTKQAFADRLSYAGDPEIAPPPLDLLLSEAYWSERAGSIDPEAARPFEYPGAAGEPARHTTHFVVADSRGNIVSATQTLGNLFGSRIMAEGTGVWLNNSLAYCTFEPKGNPMDAHAGRRKLSGDCPTIILREGRPWASLGTPGGHTIGQTVPQMVMNLIDYRMDIAQALAAPRISFIEPDSIAVESGIPDEILRSLEAKGHKLLRDRRLGNAQGLTLEYGPDGQVKGLAAASDPRGNGLAKGH